MPPAMLAAVVASLISGLCVFLGVSFERAPASAGRVIYGPIYSWIGIGSAIIAWPVVFALMWALVAAANRKDGTPGQEADGIRKPEGS